MRIAFDAKRAFLNHTGLGNYSRVLIKSMVFYYPEHQYDLYTPKQTDLYYPIPRQIKVFEPQSFLYKKFPSLWRSRGIVKDLHRDTAIYHGLSNELPYGINKHACKKVVTIHDLIFLHYPEQYKASDVAIYKRKWKYACETADKIIATSKATKNDILHFFPHIDPRKIAVVYQSYHPKFLLRSPLDDRPEIFKKLALPEHYFLYVGSIIERKNLLTLCKAFRIVLATHPDTQLLVVGKGEGKYKQQVMEYLKQHQLLNKVVFASDLLPDEDIENALPSLYHFATSFIYPSIIEGFGIPVLEAKAAGTLVITSNTSSLQEVGEDGGVLVDPLCEEEIAESMNLSIDDMFWRQGLIEQSHNNIAKYSFEKSAKHVVALYEEIL